jgi:elongation factor G
VLASRVVPVFAGSAYKHRGVEPLLDGVVAYLPSPVDRGSVVATDGSTREPSSKAPVAALAFKVSFDEHGQLTFVRVYSGVLDKGTTVVASHSGKRLRIGRLVQLMANQRTEVARLEAGEIGAVIGLPIAGGETLSAVDAPIELEAIHAPEPVMRVAIEAKTSADRERLGVALGRMIAADPSLRIESDTDTGQTLLAGMGQLHLDIAVERLAVDHDVEVTTGKPLVAYKTTLRKVARREYRVDKQTGGPGMWAHVVLEVAPAARGAGLLFEDATRGSALTREYVRGVERGVREAMEQGLLGGHPVVDVRVTVVDGQTHVNDSSELAFKIAGAAAFRLAAGDASPVVLEPIMNLAVSCDDDSLGAVIGDIGRRRGNVVALDRHGDTRVVRADVPLAETFGYAGELGGLTHGRGRFTLEPSRYEPFE